MDDKLLRDHDVIASKKEALGTRASLMSSFVSINRPRFAPDAF